MVTRYMLRTRKLKPDFPEIFRFSTNLDPNKCIKQTKIADLTPPDTILYKCHGMKFKQITNYR